MDTAIPIVENQVRSKFENIWVKVTDLKVPDYRILLWGSVIKPRSKKPKDLDIIIEYRGSKIDSDKTKSIEGWLHDKIYITDFSYIDPLVTHYDYTSDIISKSRVSQLYSVDESGWVKLE